ncbi:TPA: hypothetical protein ACH3X1_016119 [Trebouxia sp. C0004]
MAVIPNEPSHVAAGFLLTAAVAVITLTILWKTRAALAPALYWVLHLSLKLHRRLCRPQVASGAAESGSKQRSASVLHVTAHDANSGIIETGLSIQPYRGPRRMHLSPQRGAAEAMQNGRQYLTFTFSHLRSHMCGHAGESETANGSTTLQEPGWRPAAFFFQLQPRWAPPTQPPAMTQRAWQVLASKAKVVWFKEISTVEVAGHGAASRPPSAGEVQGVQLLAASSGQ